jgi:hypothetical protein
MHRNTEQALQSLLSTNSTAAGKKNQALGAAMEPPVPGWRVVIPENPELTARMTPSVSALEEDGHPANIHMHQECHQGGWKYDKDGGLVTKWHDVCHDTWLGPVCVPHMEIVWEHRWRWLAGGECEWGNNVLMLGQWWCTTKDTLEKGDMLWLGNFRKCWDDTNWFDQLAKTLEITPNIIDMTKDVDTCIKGLSGEDAKWDINNMIDYYLKRVSNVQQLFNDVRVDYIDATVNGLHTWISFTVNTWMESSKNMIDNFASGDVLTLDKAWSDSMVDSGWATFADDQQGLVSISGMGAARCLKQHMLQPIYDSSKGLVSVTLLSLVVGPAKWIAGVIQDIQDWVGARVEEAIQSDTWYGHLSRMVRSATLKACVDQYSAIDIRAVVKNPDAKLTADIDLRAVASNLVQPFVEKIKNWVMHTVVDPIAKQLAALANQVTQLIMHGVDALTGLIPFGEGLSALWLQRPEPLPRTSRASSATRALLGHLMFSSMVASR